MNTQTKLNYFVRNYLDVSQRIDWNTFNFEGTSDAHQRMIFEICLYLYKNKVSFLTRPRFKTGYIPDIFCPLFHKAIIEVRCSEKEHRTKSKEGRIPKEFLDKILFVDGNQPFSKELVL